MKGSKGTAQPSTVRAASVMRILLSDEEREFLYWVLLRERQIALEQGLFERVWVIDSIQRRLDVPGGQSVALTLGGRAQEVMRSTLLRQSRRRRAHPWSVLLARKLSATSFG